MEKPTRIDRTFLANQDSFRANVPDLGDQLLARRIYGLIAYAFQYPVLNETIFGEKYFEPKTIARLFQYNPKYLVRHHKNPQQFVDRSPEEIEYLKERDRQAGELTPGADPAWYTILDNALYNLYYTEIPYSRNTKRTTQKDGVAHVSELKGLKIFSSLKKVYVNRSKKTYYEYAEDIEFIRSTGAYYLFFDFELFRKLNFAESSAYLSMLQIRSAERYMLQQRTSSRALGDVTATNMTIDYLAALWGVVRQDSGDKSAFTRTKTALTKLVQSINEKANEVICEISWSKAGPGNRFPGTPILRFPYSQKEKEIMERDFDERLKIFSIYFLKDQFRKFSNKNFLSMEDFDKQFINYLFHENIDVEGKQRAASEAYTLVSKRVLDPPQFATIPTYIKKYIDVVLNQNQSKIRTQQAC